jgi:hypothetical protein
MSSSTSDHSYKEIDPAKMLVMYEAGSPARTDPTPPPLQPPTPARPRSQVISLIINIQILISIIIGYSR